MHGEALKQVPCKSQRRKLRLLPIEMSPQKRNLSFTEITFSSVFSLAIHDASRSATFVPPLQYYRPDR